MEKQFARAFKERVEVGMAEKKNVLRDLIEVWTNNKCIEYVSMMCLTLTFCCFITCPFDEVSTFQFAQSSQKERSNKTQASFYRMYSGVFRNIPNGAERLDRLFGEVWVEIFNILLRSILHWNRGERAKNSKNISSIYVYLFR